MLVRVTDIAIIWAKVMVTSSRVINEKQSDSKKSLLCIFPLVN